MLTIDLEVTLDDDDHIIGELDKLYELLKKEDYSPTYTKQWSEDE